MMAENYTTVNTNDTDDFFRTFDLELGIHWTPAVTSAILSSAFDDLHIQDLQDHISKIDSLLCYNRPVISIFIRFTDSTCVRAFW